MNEDEARSLRRVEAYLNRLDQQELPPAQSAGSRFWTGSGITAAEVVLADGALGNVATVMYAVAEEVGTDTGGGVAILEPGDSVVICNDGTNACTLTCTAGGGLTLARSAGADSYAASLWVVYV